MSCPARRGRLGALALLPWLAAPAATAETLRVGFGQQFRLPSEAAAAAREGDRVLIEPGQYQDCAVWRAARLSIEAAGGGAVEVSGPVCQGKALFVVAGAAIAISGITFIGAEAAEGNGAGIRAEGGDLLVSRSRFLRNQNGILAAPGPGVALVVEDSEFTSNGALVGECAHGLYAGRIGLLAVRRSRFEGTRICHHIKSRAARTEVVDSLFADGPDGQSSYLVDVPNGGDLLLQGNEMRKGPRSGNPSAAVVVGAEGVTNPTRSLRVIGNRFTNLQARRTVFVRNLSSTPAVLEGNELRGQVTPIEGPAQRR